LTSLCPVHHQTTDQMAAQKKRIRPRALLYCEFDIHAGPRIIYQHPADSIPGTLFDSFSNYVIVKPGLTRKVTSLTIPVPTHSGALSTGTPTAIASSAVSSTDSCVPDKPAEHLKKMDRCSAELCILGYPVTIENQKYPRNGFSFNLCFCFECSSADPSLLHYHRLVRKAGLYLLELETLTPTPNFVGQS